MIKGSILGAVFGLLSALPLAGAATAADQPVELKFGHWLPAKHPLHPAWEAWAEDIAKDSNGSIKITIFPSEQLGKAFDHYDMARDGIADITYVNPGYQPGRFPVIAAGELPFLFANAKEGSAAIDDWYRPYAAREMKDVHFCYAFVHDPGSFHGRKKIVVPEDVRGLKVRPANGTIGQFVTLLGGTNVQASAPESRDMLERGVADTITFPWGSLGIFGIDKVVKYHLDVPLYVTTFVIVMNKAKYEGLAPGQRTVIDNHCNAGAAEKLASPWADFEAAGREKIRQEAGHEVDEITPAELSLWRAAADPLHKQWADKAKAAGYNPDEVFGALQASLAKHQSGY
jgi:TRAP-type transport system periplasmic protein